MTDPAAGDGQRRSRPRSQRDRGEVTVTVIMMPVIIIGMMLVVQFGLAMYARQVVAGAAQDGAASGARQGSSAAAGQVVTDTLVDQSAGHLLSSYSSSASSTGDIVTVTAQGNVVRVLPLFPTITVRASGSATVEQFVPEGSP